jgi:hypothetical protein
VNWADEESLEYCLLGIPKNAPALAVQIQTLKTPMDMVRSERGLSRILAELQPKRLLVYGQERAQAVLEQLKFPNERIVFVKNRTAMRTPYMEAPSYAGKKRKRKLEV